MATSVAILGGGISGLSTAYYLSKSSPKTKILLIEGSKRLGGWIRSERVSPGFHSSVPSSPTQEPHNVLFEVGPRSLRPVGAGGAAILSLCRDLQLEKDMLFVPKTDPSAKNRYIYYQDKINTLPNSLSSLLFNSPPVFQGVLKAILSEPFVEKRGSTEKDESLYSFVARRFNEHVALNLVGAITHGIYAGDAKQLSVKSTMRMLYNAEQMHGSVVKGMFQKPPPLSIAEQYMMDALDDDQKTMTKETSVFGFKEGTEALTHRLHAWLKEQPNVTILKDKTVKKLEITPNGNEMKVFSEDASIHVDHVISTLPSRKLDQLVKDVPHLSYNPSVNVAVVNFAYENGVNLKYNGFGFLTPHPDSPCYPLPVPGTLGVVFDSNAMKGQDNNAAVTKLTVMMGGHMWDQMFRGAKPDEVDPVHVGQLARDTLRAYLGITQEPTFSMVNSLSECIPQYLVGHEARLGELHQCLQQKYPHLLSVTGASYLGVSVPDCVKHSRLLAQELLDKGALGSRESFVTGLNKITQQ